MKIRSILFFMIIFLITGCSTKDNTTHVDADVNANNIDSNDVISEDKSSNAVLTSLSWANMKIDTPDLNLSDEQKEIVKYFDSDYIYVSEYSNLQRYPKAYRGAQIFVYGTVIKVLIADDQNYECVISHQNIDGNYLVIKGAQEDSRLIEGDFFGFFGRYIDVQSYEIDGVSFQMPVISVNYSAEYFEDEGEVIDKFDFNDINRVAKAVFGNDIKIREPVYGQDFELDALHYSADFFYLITPDNQNNSNFTSFEFHTGYGAIVDAKSTVNERRSFHIAADFEHYIVSIFNPSLRLMYLEYYDRDFNKIWGREFNNVDTVPYDYTVDNIYLSADNDLYIININTGEDVITPTMVGTKVYVNAMNDGIVLIGRGNHDNIMKVSLDGEVLWKTSLDFDVTDAANVQIIDGNIIADLYHIEYDDGKSEPTYSADGYPENSVTVFQERIVVVDDIGNIVTDFVDVDFDMESYSY